jgi:hypothetical protein
VLPLFGSGKYLNLRLTAGLPSLFSYSRASSATYLSGGTILSAAINAPRFETQGLLLEPQSTNNITYSVPQPDTTNGWAYAATGTAGTVNNATAPDGTTTALLLADTTSNVQHYAIGPTSSFTASTAYTEFIFVKAGTATAIQVVFPAAAFPAGPYVNFNVSTGVVGTASGATGTITPIGGGVYRCAATATATVTASGGFIVALTNGNTSAARLPNYAGTPQSLWIWGAQTEAQAFATSYIPTAGSAVTRAADSLSLTLTSLPWLQTSAGFSVVFECDLISVAPFSSASNVLFRLIGIFGHEGSYSIGGNNESFRVGGGYFGAQAPVVGTNKYGFVDGCNGTVAACLNGGTVYTGTGAAPQGPPFISSTSNIMTGIPGHVHNVKLWGVALPSARLASVTT